MSLKSSPAKTNSIAKKRKTRKKESILSAKERIALIKKQIIANKKGEKLESTVPLNTLPIDNDAMKMGFVYEEMLSHYLHKPTLRYFTKLREKGVKKVVLTNLGKAAKLADDQKVDYKLFLESQFYWFHQWYHRYPKLNEIGSSKALERLSKYLQLDNKKETFSVTIPIKEQTKEELDKINRKNLDELAKCWGITQQEVLSKFAYSGAFDPKWIKRQNISCEKVL